VLTSLIRTPSWQKFTLVEPYASFHYIGHSKTKTFAHKGAVRAVTLGNELWCTYTNSRADLRGVTAQYSA